MKTDWDGKKYYSLNYFLRHKFNDKVFKISLDAGFSCPNRDGTISTGGCIFCSGRGSGDFAGDRCLTINEQFEQIKNVMKNKWKSGKYIAYFQAYTNTYASVSELRKKYDEAVNNNGVVALAIATRPDCLEDDVIDLIAEYNKKIYTWVELGLQTSNENTAKLINRGYTLNIFEKAVSRLRERDIDVVVHTILGLPKETRIDMLNTIKYVADMDVQGIKLHLLHLMEDTPLVELYNKGELDFMTKDEYVTVVCEAITLLPQTMVIHRLTGDAPRKLLVEPQWSLKKWEVLNDIDRYLVDNNLYQGKYYKTKSNS